MDDDFDVSVQSERNSCNEQVDEDAIGIEDCSCDLHEQALQTVSRCPTSKIEGHHSLVKGLTESTIAVSALVHLVNLVDINPLLASLKNFAM
jgi:hypothetical protein